MIILIYNEDMIYIRLLKDLDNDNLIILAHLSAYNFDKLLAQE
jgi:hypothetical protein